MKKTLSSFIFLGLLTGGASTALASLPQFEGTWIGSGHAESSVAGQRAGCPFEARIEVTASGLKIPYLYYRCRTLFGHEAVELDLVGDELRYRGVKVGSVWNDRIHLATISKGPDGSLAVVWDMEVRDGRLFVLEGINSFEAEGPSWLHFRGELTKAAETQADSRPHEFGDFAPEVFGGRLKVFGR